VVRNGYQIGVPQAGDFAEILNTDAQRLGGSNVGNLGHVTASEQPCHGLPCSVVLTLPPLATLYLEPLSGRPTATLAP
jgi:1,4-alpha-glucan branching enzyme